jgi:hypothetical protein
MNMALDSATAAAQKRLDDPVLVATPGEVAAHHVNPRALAAMPQRRPAHG